MRVIKNFWGSLLFTVAALLLAGWLGYSQTGQLSGALSLIFIAAVLGVMETSLSLDNAVVNASVLKDMDEKWQRRFLTWGIAIAVFGMRIVFPVLIVAFAAWVTPWEALRIAIADHELYEEIITQAHISISGFGGAFLLLVGLNFFLDPDREHFWLRPVEKPLAALTRIPFVLYLISITVIVAVSMMIEGDDQRRFLIAGLSGVATFFFVDWIGNLLGKQEGPDGMIVRSGAGAFIYLEFLDASFSFDGVIGAFAITNDILLIALGLGIGAMFVRSMTIALVRGGTLAEFRYLEAGAFYAILALAGIMLLSVRIHIPEVVTGLLGATIIGIALWHSIVLRRRDRANEGASDGASEGGDAESTPILPTGETRKDGS